MAYINEREAFFKPASAEVRAPGNATPALSLNEYQRLSARSANPHEHELINYGLGIAGEAGEVADLIKKSMFHGHSVDTDEVKKELGDVLWYVSQIARLAGVTLEDVAAANVEKLKQRYPDGFSEESSINRQEDE